MQPPTSMCTGALSIHKLAARGIPHLLMDWFIVLASSSEVEHASWLGVSSEWSVLGWQRNEDEEEWVSEELDEEVDETEEDGDGEMTSCIGWLVVIVLVTGVLAARGEVTIGWLLFCCCWVECIAISSLRWCLTLFIWLCRLELWLKF